MSPIFDAFAVQSARWVGSVYTVGGAVPVEPAFSLGSITTVLLLLGLGAWVALDHVSVGQFMVARPLVGGTLAGILAGDPFAGVVAGGLLDLLHIAQLPVGAARIPEPGPGGVVAGFVSAGTPGGGGLALGVGVGVLVSIFAGQTMQWHRAANQSRVDRAHAQAMTGSNREARRVALIRGLFRALLRAVWADGVRGALLVIGGVGAAFALAPWLASRWFLGFAETAALLAVPGLIALGGVGRFSLQGGWLRGPLLLAGGLLVGWMLGAWVFGGWGGGFPSLSLLSPGVA